MRGVREGKDEILRTESDQQMKKKEKKKEKERKKKKREAWVEGGGGGIVKTGHGLGKGNCLIDSEYSTPNS